MSVAFSVMMARHLGAVAAALVDCCSFFVQWRTLAPPPPCPCPPPSQNSVPPPPPPCPCLMIFVVVVVVVA